MTTPIRVLIVEDVPDDAELMALRLAEEGFQPDWQRVDTEPDYLAALDEPPDLILADWTLPQFSGPRALKLLRQRDLDIPFVIISGSIGEEAAVDALHRGAHDYVLKDRPGRLGRAVQHALEQRRLRKERRQTQEALRASQRKLQSIFSAAPVGIGLVKDRVILEANQTLLSITGYSHQELVGRDARILYPTAADYEYVGRDLYAQIAEDGTGTVETRWRTKDGAVIDVLLSASYFDPDDPSKGMTGTVLDITARKRAEKELQNTLAELSAIHQNAPLAMMLVDPESRVRKVNGAAARFAGRTPQEMIGLVGGQAFRCLNALDDPQGCGYGPRCADCRVRRAVLDTFEDQESRDGIEAWLPFPSDEGTEERCLRVSTAYLQIDGQERVLLCARDITRRKRAEEALRASEERYRSVFENTGVDVAIVDLNGYVVEANEADCQFFGYSRAELIGMHFSEFTHPEDMHLDVSLFQSLIDGERQTYNIEKRYVRKDGDVVWGRVAVSLIRDAQGTPSYTSVLRYDITDRKRAEQALRASEEKYRLLAEHSADVIYKMNIENEEYTYVSPSVERLLGYTPSEALLLSPSDVLTPDSYAKQWEALQETLVDDSLASEILELDLFHKDGHVVPVEINASFLFDEHGDPVEILGVVRDITEATQARAERERLLVQVREQAQRVQAIIDTVPTGVLLLDARGHVHHANPVAHEDLAVLAGAGVGGVVTHLGSRPLGEFLTSPPQGLWHEVEAEGRTFEVIGQPVAPARTSESTGGAEPQHWVLVINDVTQERQVRAQLRHQERLATVGQLAAGIAHDFNNILAAIQLYAQLSLRSSEDPDKLRERLNVIVSETNSAANLVQQILDFSRQAPIDRSPLDLLSLLQEQVQLLRRTLPEHVEIELDAAGEEFTINADRTRVQQTIVNLALNARDAMPSGGRLRITLRRVTPGSALRCVTCGPVGEGEWIEVAVTDTGTGIPPDVLPRMFEPFFTTREPVGHGLGLAQVYGIVKQHGGHVDVETEQGVGTTFRLYWPALSTAPPVSREGADSVSGGRGETILVVEDDAPLQAALVDILESLNYTVLSADDGREALTLLESHAGDIALVLSDCVMPHMGGERLAQEIQTRFPGTPVLMLTGHALSESARQSAPAAVIGWAQKPLNVEALSAAVARALQEAD